MAIQMTRAQYEEIYGVKPVFSSTSVLDDEKPAPVQMTRAEYEETYYPKQPKRELVKETVGDVKETVLGVGKSVGDIYGKSMDIAEDKDFTLPQKTMGIMGKIAGGVSGAIGNLVFGAGKVLLSQKQEDKLKSIVGSAAQGVTETDTAKSVIDWYGGLDKNDKLFVDSVGGVASLMADVYTPGVAKTAAKPVVTGVKDVVKTAEELVPKVTQKLDRRGVNNVVDEITKIEEKYAKSRTADSYMKPDDVAASRARIAESNVLDGAVDTNGVIRTADAIDNYRIQTIDGLEDTVRKGLIESKETIPVTMVRQALVREVGRSGLEGADLVSALKKIDKEMEGLNTRIKGSSIVDLRYLHDNKIATTKNINYQTPPEKATYRKAVARAYKTLVEENSKKVEVKKINDELKQYYGDIDRLKRLDGARAEGGRLGKYTASMAGTLIGGAAGSVGGGFGAAVGGIIGGEAAAALKGAGMARTFKGGGKGVPKSAVLEKARLSIPDKAIKAKAGVPKTKEITKLEKDIAKNVADQKKAIKKGDFTLVAALKDVYAVLVAELKKAIKYLNENGSVGMSIRKSISPEQKRIVADALDAYDEAPITVKGIKDYKSSGSTDRDFRLIQLKEKNSNGVFTDADALEAQKLLQDVGALDKAMPVVKNDLATEAKKYPNAEDFVKAQESKILQHVSDNPNLTKFEKMSEVNKVYNDKLKEFEALDKQRKSLKTFDDIEKFDDKKWLELKNWLSTNDKIKLGERGANAGEGIYLSSKPDFWRGALESEGKPMGDYTYDVLVTNPTKAKEYMQTAGGGQMLPETLIQPNEGIILGKSGEVDVTKKLTDIWNKANGKGKTDPIVEEAKKYKSAEEFVRSKKSSIVSADAEDRFIETFKSGAEDGKISGDIWKGAYFKETVIPHSSKLKADEIVDASRVNYWKEKIKSGDRTPVLIDVIDGVEDVVDGSHKLQAYKQLKIDVPVIKRYESSTLTDIWNKANRKASGDGK